MADALKTQPERLQELHREMNDALRHRHIDRFNILADKRSRLLHLFFANKANTPHFRKVHDEAIAQTQYWMEQLQKQLELNQNDLEKLMGQRKTQQRINKAYMSNSKSGKFYIKRS